MIMTGTLPWSMSSEESDDANKVYEAYERTVAVKVKTSVTELCSGLPREMLEAIMYIKSLRMSS